MNPSPKDEKVTARVAFTGVMLMCINEKKRFEAGMIRCPKHDPLITVTTLTDGAPPKRQTVKWPEGHDIIFKVNQPEADEVVIHPHGSGDTDFNKVIDLEGPDLHDEQVKINLALLDGRRLGITAGKLYASDLSNDELDLLTWSRPDDKGTLVKNLGKIAEEVSLNIVCRDEQGSGIEIVDSVTKEVIDLLPNRADTTYFIEVNNDCERLGPTPPPVSGEISDFRFYYDVISVSGSKFDLRTHVPSGGATAGPGPGPIPAPGICESARLSKTKTLGVQWP